MWACYREVQRNWELLWDNGDGEMKVVSLKGRMKEWWKDGCGEGDGRVVVVVKKWLKGEEKSDGGVMEE